MRMPFVMISRCCHISVEVMWELFSTGIVIHNCSFYLLDQVGHRDTTRASIGAVKNRAATPYAATLSQDAKAFSTSLIAAVEDEAVRIHNRGWPNPVGITPHRWA